MSIYLPRFGNFSVIISLNKLSAPFFLSFFLPTGILKYIYIACGIPYLLCVLFTVFSFCFSNDNFKWNVFKLTDSLISLIEFP